MYNLKANFFPAHEPKNGYIGVANLTIGNAIRINGIAVFDNHDNGGHHIQFPGYGEGDKAGSYVIPSSKEAYAAMLDVVEKAIGNENHFGWSAGEMNPRMSVSGIAVEEPLADGRFSIDIQDLCSLRGVTTREVNYTEAGNVKSFVSVDMPSLPPYTNRENKTVYPNVFEGLVSKYEKDGHPKEKDFGQLIRDLVLSERIKAHDRRPSLEETMSRAQEAAHADTHFHHQMAEPVR